MKLTAIRHGATAGNLARRYIGRTDEPLCPEALRELERRGGDAAETRVYVSPMLRARATAELMFPNAALVAVPGFREMDFGDFEGRSAADMEHDAAYRAWVDGMCEGRCPGGESKADFTARTCAAFRAVFAEAFARGDERLVIVAHGGTVMSIMSVFAEPPRGYYEWNVKNLGGWTAGLELRAGGPALTCCEPV